MSKATERANQYLILMSGIGCFESEGEKVIRDLLAELEKAEKVIDAAIDIYDNRLGWSEGRNPYALISFWEGLNKALANYKGEIKCQICDDDDLHCNYCTKGEDK